MEILHTFIRLEPKPGMDGQLRDALHEIAAPTRAEPGCLLYRVYESTSGPQVFYIHSQWMDDSAFDAHAARPHTQRFLSVVESLLTHPVAAVRTKVVF
jgi:quinol monooxygenase YgiN